MSRWFVIVFVAVEIAALLAQCAVFHASAVAQTAHALSEQQQQVGFPQHLMLMNTRPVRDELDLSRQQRDEVDKLAREFMEQAFSHHQRTQELIKRFADLPDAQPEVVKALLQEQIVMAQETDARAFAFLEPRQLKRLAQLQLRARGWSMFLDPQVRKQLQISNGQYAQISQVFDDCVAASKELQKLAVNQRIEREEAVRGIREARRTAFDKMRESLTSRQKQSLDRLLGPKPQFHLDEINLRLTLTRSVGKASIPRTTGESR